MDDKDKKKQISKVLLAHYEFAKMMIPVEDFESAMADIAADIIDMQSKCKEGTSFLAAGMLLSMPPNDGELDSEWDEDYPKFIGAAMVWYLTDFQGSNK